MDIATDMDTLLRKEIGKIALPSKRTAVIVTRRNISRLFARPRIEPEVNQQMKLNPVVLITSLRMTNQLMTTFHCNQSASVKLLHLDIAQGKYPRRLINLPS